MFDAAKKSTEELIEDTNCIASLTAVGALYPVKRSVERAYAYPQQFTKMTAEDDGCVALDIENIKSVRIPEHDPKTRRIKLRIGDKVSRLSPRCFGSASKNAYFHCCYRGCHSSAG